jgi:hypothetical protein
MSEDKAKKPKIDLKARLNKTIAGTGVPGPVLPGARETPIPGSDPMAFGGRADGTPVPAPPIKPLGIAPPPGIGVAGVSLPHFGPKPVAAPKAAPVSAEAQTIKVEVGEEIHEQRKQASRRVWLGLFAGAVLGLAIGFLAGGRNEKAGRDKESIAQAGKLQGDVQNANEKMKELGALLDQGAESLGNKKYPDLVEKLAGVSIPFDDANIDPRAVAGMPPKTVKLVLGYTKGVQDLNDKKDSLRNLLGILKEQVEKAWAEEKKPVFNLSVVFKGGGEKIIAELVRNKAPFAADALPADYVVIVKENREGKRVDAEKKATRWVKGDLTGSSPISIPIEPASSADYTNERVVTNLRKAIIDMKILLEGDSSDPQAAKAGLLKDGEVLVGQLNDISLKK